MFLNEVIALWKEDPSKNFTQKTWSKGHYIYLDSSNIVYYNDAEAKTDNEPNAFTLSELSDDVWIEKNPKSVASVMLEQIATDISLVPVKHKDKSKINTIMEKLDKVISKLEEEN
jgi:predicted nucleotide-binding protein